MLNYQRVYIVPSQKVVPPTIRTGIMVVFDGTFFLATNNQQSTIYIYIWVNLITTEPCSPEAWFIMVYFRETIPFYGRTIQVSEIL